MIKRLAAAILALALLLGTAALGEEYHIAEGNDVNLGELLIDLLHAYEKPSDGDAQAIDGALEKIRAVSEEDYALASAITDQWRKTYLDPNYVARLYRGGERATELEQSSLADSATHAFVVLGYELKNGEMADELKGRCAAAAAAARSYPGAILVCSGGATGKNNPEMHTEAGMMRDYLRDKCGIDASRIHIDEAAMNTVQNAVNSFAIMRDQGIETFTLVTSSYHQRWAQVIYRAMAEVCRQKWGYTARIVENYSYDIEPSERYRRDDIMAVRQLTSILKLSDEVIEAMKAMY